MMFKRRKVSWSDHDRRGVCEGGENCLKDLKRGWNRKEGRGNKDLKRWGKVVSRGECLKKGWAGTPLRTMAVFLGKILHAFGSLGPKSTPLLSYHPTTTKQKPVRMSLLYFTPKK